MTGMRILFLGYDRQQTKLISHIEALGHELMSHNAPVADFEDCDLVISFGYRHIITKEALASAKRPPINLHISYLPFNRGAHPNFWALVDNTPWGVTIHEIDEGIDTGPIIVQSQLECRDKTQSFGDTYQILQREIEDLFIAHMPDLLSGSYQAQRQTTIGTYHSKADLPDWMTNWSMPILSAIEKMKGQ